jgi:hypothetical protein
VNKIAKTPYSKSIKPVLYVMFGAGFFITYFSTGTTSTLADA